MIKTFDWMNPLSVPLHNGLNGGEKEKIVCLVIALPWPWTSLISWRKTLTMVINDVQVDQVWLRSHREREKKWGKWDNGAAARGSHSCRLSVLLLLPPPRTALFFSFFQLGLFLLPVLCNYQIRPWCTTIEVYIVCSSLKGNISCMCYFLDFKNSCFILYIQWLSSI